MSDQETADSNKIEVKVAQAENWKAWAGVVSAVLALIAAAFSSYVSTDNQGQIEENRTLLENIQKDYEQVEAIAASFQIDTIETQPDKNVYKLSGTYLGNLSDFHGKDVWVFWNDRRLFYPSHGKVVLSADKRWYHPNVNIKPEGKFEVLIVVADQDQFEELNYWNNQTDARGYSGLPQGLQVINSITVRKRGTVISVI